jgi:hypothetical protein
MLEAAHVSAPIPRRFSASLLALCAHARERVHLGQGLHDRRYPFYEGILPTGRNYAVHPRIACLAGGIDPLPRASAEDSLVFGSDIYNLLGNEAKSFAEDISVITHPRREIVTVAGREEVYEDFHAAAAESNRVGLQDLHRLPLLSPVWRRW